MGFMGSKIAWVLLPLVLYGLLLVLAWRGRAPSRMSVNMHGSLLLMVYLLTTAGLGLFWVANQQLPVFDWHFLFGYATLLLVSLHLFFNLPLLVRWLRQRRSAAPEPAASASAQGAAGSVLRWRVAGAWLAAPVALGLAFWLGMLAGDGGHGPAAPVGATPEDAVQAALRFHEYSSESRTSAFRRAPVPSLDLQLPVFKTYAGVPHIALERGAPAQDGRSLGAMLRGPGALRPLTLVSLGQLLYLSAGVTARRGGIALRAAPSSGALFPAELYVVARRVSGLPSGLYHYDPEHHRLDALGGSPAWFSPAPGIADPDALIVVAAVFDRTAWKYRNRAYRYVAADLGHLLENVRLAGHYAGLPVHLPVLFDEAQTAHALGLDGRQEGVLALAALGGRATVPPPATDAARGGAKMPAGVTGVIHAATSLGAGEAPHLAAAQSAGEKPDVVALPRAVAAAADLHATIAKRRSQRRFAADHIALADLAALLADMAQKPLLSNALRADLVVNRVTGLPPGVYRYLPDRHALKLVRQGEFAQQAQSAALSQDVIGGAAVVLILSAERLPMFAQGARGYRMAFLEAGMMGQRWLLGATARGLAACPVGAFYDDEAAKLVQADPQQRWVLHFAALGKPAP